MAERDSYRIRSTNDMLKTLPPLQREGFLFQTDVKPIIQSIGVELTLLIILFVGLFLRIYHLGYESIWIDEGYSIIFAKLNPSQIIEVTSKDDFHTPFYYIILHYWMNLFGDSEFSIRFPSAIFGFLAILMIYKVGSLIFDKKVGLLSSLILALSIFHIHYSQDARMYSLMAFLTLVSMYFFIRLMKERSFGTSIGYILSSTLLIYTQYFGLFIVVAQNIYLATLFLFSREKLKINLRKWVLLQVTIILLFAPWIVILVKQMLRVKSGFWIPEPTFGTLVKSFRVYSGHYLFILFLILSFFSAVRFKRIRGKINWKGVFKSAETYGINKNLSDISNIYLLLVWLLTPIILPFIISKVLTPVYWDRYTIGASVAFYILIAKGISNINHKYVKSAVIGIVVIGSLVNVWGYHTGTNKEQWRGIANYVDANAQPGDLVLFNADFCQYSFDYHSERTDLVKKPLLYSEVDKENIKNLRPIVRDYNRVWAVLAYTSDDNKERIKETLNEFHKQSYDGKFVSYAYATGDYAQLELYLFKKK
ncbi:MAG TPA: glycosyltransferase family 39 protein [Thermodesulfobacteriota bacterium]|nr:glycosyltransferase family 39 protein [Thermodesulfobacteriota bacterium]